MLLKQELVAIYTQWNQHYTLVLP